MDGGTRPPRDPPRDLRRPRGAGRVIGARRRSRAPIRIGLLGCGTVGQAVVRTLHRRRRDHRAGLGPPPRGRPGAGARPRARAPPGIDPALHHGRPRAGAGRPLGLDRRRGDGRRRARARLPAHGPGARRLGRDGQQAAAVAPRSRAAAGRRGGRRRAALRGLGLRRDPGHQGPARVAARGRDRPRVTGIVNGTTNFILTEMARGGLSYAEALARAQELGYAEADPTEDVNGADAAAKMAILSSIAFHSRVLIDDVPYEGIDRLEAEDLAHAEALGFVVKLVGVARLLNGSVSVRVYPALVPRGHRLAAIGGPDNAVLLESRTTREIMLVGPGRRRRRDRLGRGGRHPVDPRHPPGLVPAQRPGRRRPPDRPAGVGRRRPSTCARPWPTAPACSRAWRSIFADAGPVDPLGRAERIGRRGEPGAGAALGARGAHAARRGAHPRARRRARRAGDAAGARTRGGRRAE